MEVARSTVPEGRGRTDDFVFEAGFSAPDGIWSVGLAKFLGPKRLFRQGHVYELTIVRPDAWQGHLFENALPALFDRFRNQWPRLLDGETDLADLIPKAEAHEERILLCHG